MVGLGYASRMKLTSLYNKKEYTLPDVVYIAILYAYKKSVGKAKYLLLDVVVADTFLRNAGIWTVLYIFCSACCINMFTCASVNVVSHMSAMFVFNSV